MSAWAIEEFKIDRMYSLSSLDFGKAHGPLQLKIEPGGSFFALSPLLVISVQVIPGRP